MKACSSSALPCRRRMPTTRMSFLKGCLFYLCISCLPYLIPSALRVSPSVPLGLSKAIRHLDDQTRFNHHNNFYLQGLFAPVKEEHFNIPMSLISGHIPKDMNGLFLRIGPNPLAHYPHDAPAYHLFDGHGMIHPVRIQDGKATYSNQWVQTPNYLLSRRYDQVVYPQLGEMKGMLGLFKVLVLDPMLSKAFNQTHLHHGTANTALLLYRTKLYAMHERSLPFELQWQENNSFISLGYEDFNGQLHYPMTAHPKVKGDKLYFNGYSAHDGQPALAYGEVHRDKLVMFHGIDSPHRTFAHDMIVTDRYALMIEPSIVFDKHGILEGNCFQFAEHNMRIAVRSVSNGSEVRWFSLPKPLACLHILNAWEEEQEIVLHLPVSHDFNGMTPFPSQHDAALSINPSKGSARTTLVEVRLDLMKGTSILRYYRDSPPALPFPWRSPDSSPSPPRIHLDDVSVEFPTLHPAFLGKKARFGYGGICTDVGLSHIGKFDMHARRLHSTIALPRGMRCGEPVVIPKQGEGQASDSVYLASFATDIRSDTSDFLVYDGHSMHNQPVLRLRLGSVGGQRGLRVPFGLHGMFIPDAVLTQHIKRARSEVK